MSENNDTSNESNSLGSDSTLQLSRLFGGGSNNPIPRSGVLRPSVLGPSVLGSAFSIKNEVIQAEVTHDKKNEEISSNPFIKEHQEEKEVNTTENVQIELKNKEEENVNDNKSEDDDELDERPDPLTLLRKNGIERANLFAAAKSSIPLVEKSGFVFGQNVHERVVGENINSNSISKTENFEAGSTTGEFLFSSVIHNAVKTKDTNDSDGNIGRESKTLNDVAREYEESRAQKRKYEEVETFTGEENEVNIVDVNCKLFAFVNSNWEERGRGSLRLNDSKKAQECSRVVFRSSGNLRLLINTKVWAGMVAERPSQKSLRLTAMDNTGKIKVFLVMARPLDITQLHKSLVERIAIKKSTHPEELDGVSETEVEDSKNGDVDSDSANKSEPKTSAPDNESKDSSEPSPKKTALAETN